MNELSVSVIVPARNEKGNIAHLVERLPSFGTSQEIIFIEGHSTDGTWEEILHVQEQYKGNKHIVAVKQNGVGKADAMRAGFALAKGEALLILDADMTVPPEEMPRFYQALVSGKGDFINGSRMIYKRERGAMRFLNVLANKGFAFLFSWALGQRITDTLCGTKAFLRTDYEKIAKVRSYFGTDDPFGDFDLFFGAAHINLKIVEIPVRYKARTYGTTQIHRFSHGWQLLKVFAVAVRKIKRK